jgi:hypothetical protein
MSTACVSTMTTLEVASRLVALGFSVIPLERTDTSTAEESRPCPTP